MFSTRSTSRNAHLYAYNIIAKYLHWCILKDQDWLVLGQWQLHKMLTKKEGKTIKLGEGVKLWWDKTVQ
eukprot:11861935-Ditylum_brightwellii.AAC.1